MRVRSHFKMKKSPTKFWRAPRFTDTAERESGPAPGAGPSVTALFPEVHAECLKFMAGFAGNALSTTGEVRRNQRKSPPI